MGVKIKEAADSKHKDTNKRFFPRLFPQKPVRERLSQAILAHSFPTRRVNLFLPLRSRRTQDKIEDLWKEYTGVNKTKQRPYRETA